MQLERTTWQKDLQNSVTTLKELKELGFEIQDYDSLNKITDKYPMSIPNYYLNLIKKKDYSDPIYKMCIASIREGAAGGNEDTSGEGSNTVGGGIQHKYDSTVLLLSTNVCAMYCRHCFRKRLVGQSEEEILKFTDEAIEYVRNHPEVNNILISGGDALLNSNKIIKKYLENFSQIEHVKFIRFGSRTPVVLPQRIYNDPELLDILRTYSKIKTIFVVTQFNHPREFTKEAIKATDMLREAGVPLLNQTVLLKGVNDDVKTLKSLFTKMTSNGISPYYLFQCRPVKGVKDLFAVPLLKAVELVDKTKAELSGVDKRFRFIMSHIRGKIEILGKMDNNTLLLKQHQAKDNDDLNNIFTIKVENNSLWFNDELTGGI